MRNIFLPLSFCLLLGSCKLMKKKEADQNKSDKVMTTKFTAPEWTHSTNIYEVNVRQYTPEGTFNAFSNHLPRLKEMGVQTLWFMPVTPIAQKNKKGALGSYYACSDYTAINPEFGTLDDFKALVKKAHGMGFKVIIDWVANHTGWDHKWTVSNPDYYLRDTATNDFKIASGMDDIIELDFSNKSLRKAMKDAMAFWIKECDIDGFRADLAFWVELDFWKEARVELDAIKPLFWLGEYDELDNPDYGDAFDASYTWTWMHRAKDFYQQKQSIDSLYTVLNRYAAIGDKTMRAWFTTNHDENSWNGTEYEKYGDFAWPLAVFSTTWNGIPLIYSGQEIPNQKRLEFFQRDPLSFSEQPSLHHFYKTLFTLRATNPALRGGDSTVQTINIHTSQPGVMAWLRRKDNHEVLVVINATGKGMDKVDITDANINGVFRNVFDQTLKDLSVSKTIAGVKGWGYYVFEK